MEVRQAASISSVTPEGIRFCEIRDDWYRGADLMARLIGRAALGSPVTFEGFPRQWLPIFAFFGAAYRALTEPLNYTPIATELSNSEIERLVEGARAVGRLRQLAEVFSATDPVIADVLHLLDRRLGSAGPQSRSSYVPLTGWQSYGRAEVQALEARIEESGHPGASKAVALPCARGRPYERSRTHKRLLRALKADGIEPPTVDQIVISSIGVIPHQFWEDPVVLAYDSGVPDIYRVLRLIRKFFSKARYELVIDCLEFAPYSDCLQIAASEGLIGRIQKGPKGRVRKLPRP